MKKAERKPLFPAQKDQMKDVRSFIVHISLQTFAQGEKAEQ